ncbi:MAG: arylesterase [Rhodocyclales bacterium]|nr:arylesterase [Rhodocyclales bacterium]
MGDSLSAGYGIDQQSAWPSLLEQKLKNEGYRYEVHNASISGETTAGGLTRIAEALQRTQPQVVIVELGANDGLRGLSLKSMRDNLDAMITASQKASAKVLLVGMRMPPNLGQTYTEKFQTTFNELAKTRKTALVPFLFEGMAGHRELFQADGLHPVASAQPRLLENVWPQLRTLLKK